MKLIRLIYKYTVLPALLWISFNTGVSGQNVPSRDENIPFLVTFGKEGKTSWGDDDFNSVWFFTLPKDYTRPFYIRVFDAECGGANDEIQGEFNSKTLFSIYGGKGVDPEQNEESQGFINGLDYKKGNLLASKVFGTEARYDDKYYTFGPFNPTDGDFNVKWDSYIFKVVCEGVAGDDGNLYRYSLSSDPNNNIAIENANAFTYEYTFRMWNDFKSVAHIYPFVDTGIVSIQQRNFDWDTDGKILVVSRYKQGQLIKEISDEDRWTEGTISIDTPEWLSSLDFQFHKRQGELVKNNNVVITLRNQRGDALKFFSNPIGGVPVYQMKSKYQQVPKK